MAQSCKHLRRKDFEPYLNASQEYSTGFWQFSETLAWKSYWSTSTVFSQPNPLFYRAALPKPNVHGLDDYQTTALVCRVTPEPALRDIHLIYERSREPWNDVAMDFQICMLYICSLTLCLRIVGWVNRKGIDWASFILSLVRSRSRNDLELPSPGVPAKNCYSSWKWSLRFHS